MVPESVSKLLANLNLDLEVSAPKKEPEPPKEETKPKAEPKAAPAPAAKTEPAAPAEPGLRVRKQKLTRPELPVVQPVAPAAPVAKDEPYRPDPQWESSLEENEREMLADAKDAEALFPDKYKGLAAKTAKYLKEHAELTAREDFDDQSPKYKQWLAANQPKLSRQEVRELEETRVAKKVNQQWEGKYSDLQHKIFVREAEPKIEQEGRAVFSELSHSSLPEDVAKAVKEQGYEEASKTYGLELQTAQNVLTAAAEDIMELRRLSTKDPETGRPLQAPVQDPSHPKFAQHQRLGEMVGYLCEDFKTKATAEQQLRDGKWFVTRDEWASIRPDQRHRFWTFTNQELIAEAKKNAKLAVSMAIERQRGSMQKLGWQPPTAKVAAPPVPPKSDPPVPTNTPRVPAATPVPGATDVMSEIDARAKRLASTLNRD